MRKSSMSSPRLGDITASTCGYVNPRKRYVRRFERYRDGKRLCSRCRQYLEYPADFYGDSWCRLCHQLRKYNIDRNDYERTLAEQDGVCAICRSADPKANKGSSRFVVDHDHSCCPPLTSCGDCVRWLLCNPCNVMIGAAQDDPIILERAAVALRQRANEVRHARAA